MVYFLNLMTRIAGSSNGTGIVSVSDGTVCIIAHDTAHIVYAGNGSGVSASGNNSIDIALPHKEQPALPVCKALKLRSEGVS